MTTGFVTPFLLARLYIRVVLLPVKDSALVDTLTMHSEMGERKVFMSTVKSY